MTEKRYYWLKLKKDFFDNLRMKKLRSIAGGDTYTIIYLKMQLLSLQNEGMLFYEGVEESFEQEIALLINENVEDVKITINFLIANNLLIQNNNSFELVETKTCIGSETRQAESMRKLRKERNNLLENGNNVTTMLPNVTKCYTEKEKDIEIEKEKEKETEIEKEKKINKYNRVIEIYNTYCTNLSQVQKLTEKRKIAINKLLKEINIDQFTEICIIANKSDFLIGNNDRNWKADFDFVIRPDKAVSILEGKYNFKKKDKMDGFRELWEEARIKDEQTGNNTNNNTFGW